MRSFGQSQLLVIILIPLICGMSFAWNAPVGRAGPITITIDEFGDVEQLGEPIPVAITVQNDADEWITGQLRVRVIDQWRIAGPSEKVFFARANDSATYEFTVIAGLDSYAAHYPVHAYADFSYQDDRMRAHAVYVTKVADSAVTGPTRTKPGMGELTAVQAAQSVTLDGDLSEWGKAPAVPLGAEQISTGNAGPDDFSPIVRLLHDPENLYVGLQMTDDDISAGDTTSRDFMNSDYIRLYLAPTPPDARDDDELTTEDVVVAINPLAADGPLVKVPEYDLPLRHIDVGAVAVAAQPTATGYAVEVAVPLELIGDGIGAGSDIGFNLMLGDADGGGRQAEMTIGAQTGTYWTNPQCYGTLHLSESTKTAARPELPTTAIADRGVTALDRYGRFAVTIFPDSRPPKRLPLGFYGTDRETGASFAPSKASRPDTRSCISTHPPYRDGTGRIAADARFALPDITPITLTFATAIRDNTEDEPPSDGVEWRVDAAAEGEDFRTLFTRFSDAKKWEPAEVDLSQYAGKTVTLRLSNGPGPDDNTVCDTGYWGEPTLIVGQRPEPESAEKLQARMDAAAARAKNALAGNDAPFQWLIDNAPGRFGVGWAPGPNGLCDGALAFATGVEVVAFDGFIVEIDESDLRDWRSQLQIIDSSVITPDEGNTIRVVDTVSAPGAETFTIQAEMRAADGALNISFSMPGVDRDKRGKPRFTRLGPGPATATARRVYAGFGNVVENPGKFSLGASGFALSTRHVGIDFDNGISLVQASDVFPYRFAVDPEKKLYSLQTGHDATMTFVPSTQGAFAAARVYRDVADFDAGGGVEKLKGKMAIDWWGGHEIADDIRRAAAYGLNDSVFIKHAWQRWGYDYRLPDIYPPACDPEIWGAWTQACRDAGMLFAVHDNYIDFYPDASGYSYDYILFNRDGTPQKAWFNEGRDARSYRWRPGAYWPWLVRNIHLIKQGFAPTAYFIDVFSAIPPLDYYDRDGRFHTKMECARHWGEAFDYVREQLGDNAPQISECGHDALIGHLDGAQADHHRADTWGWQCADSERVPWHDMATHGDFVLLAGGLGHRYAGGKPYSGWGSDDYLSNTVIGGRNPMCIGPCRRDTVMTYWLQHDICDQLADQSLQGHEFVGGNIHRQHTTFSDGGEVWTNRGDEPWEVNGRALPQYGYLAISADITSEISQRGGLRCRRATSPGATFVDARPISLDTASRAPVKTRVVSAEHLGDGNIEVVIEWEVLKPLPEGYVVFVHVCHEKVTGQSENIAIHAPNDLAPEKLQQVGTHECHVNFRIPPDMWEGDYSLRYGIYSPETGRRLLPIAYLDGARVRGGIFHVDIEDGTIASIEYKPEKPGADAPPENVDGRMIDFEGIRTNGAFRLLHGDTPWKLVPLQGSLPFEAEIDLVAFGAGDEQVAAIVGIDQQGNGVSEETFAQDGATVTLDLNAEAFAYLIRFE